MSTNVFTRLRALLPPEPVLIGRVTEHHDDDTSTIELPIGIPLTPVALGVSTGSLIRVRGRTVAVGKNAWVRGGVVQSEAPEGDPVDVVTGSIITAPQGPQGITFTGPVPDPAATVGVAFDLDLTPFFSGYYPALVFALTAGDLTGSGLALDAGTGHIGGTPLGAGALAGLVVTTTDATGLTAATGAFTITVGV
jgi:hypothetical protein